MNRALVFIAAATLAACFDPTFHDTTCVNGTCPSGLTCVAGVCRDGDPPIDAASVDASCMVDDPGPCDPLAPAGQQGCGSCGKCTWTGTELACGPDGDRATGQSCTHDVTTGNDDCAAGSYCITGVCADLCKEGAAGGACAADQTCTLYQGLFTDGYGACNGVCDPLSQHLPDGRTCPDGKGCYLLTSASTTRAVCATPGTVPVGQMINGQAFANSCVPGAQPRSVPVGSGVECGALCRPADVTSSTNMGSEGGVAPDTCMSKGAAAPGDATNGESCRFWWGREPFNGLSPFSNTLGWCFKHAASFYDSDGNGSLDRKVPRCTTLTTGDVAPPVTNPPGNDALYFWCIAKPATLLRPTAPPEPMLDRLAPPR